MTTITDNFNRANESPLAAPWTEESAGFGWNLSSNAATPRSLGSDCEAIYNGAGAPTWGNDQYSQIDLSVTGTAGGSQGGGLWVRHAAGSTRTGYCFVADHAASNNVEIQKFVSGTYSSLGFATVASWTDGDTWKIQAVGTTISVYRLGVLVASATDSAITSGSPGLRYSSTETAVTVDNWVGSDDLAVAPVLYTPRIVYSNILIG